MTRLAYFIHGRGRGHAVRTEAVVARLRTQYPALDLRIFAHASERPRFAEDAEFYAIESVPRGLASVPAMMRLRAQHLEALQSWGAELVISDGDAASLLAAQSLQLPTIAVGHNVLFTRAELPPETSTVAKLYEIANAWLSTTPADRAVASSFIPLAPKDEKTRVARPDPRWTKRPKTGDDGFYLAYFRDGDDGGLVDLFASTKQKLRIYGEFHGSLPDGAIQRPFDDAAFLEDLARCRAVVGTGGSNLITEAVYLRKPIFAVYKRMDMEQRINVSMLSARSLGDGAAMRKVDRDDVLHFVRRVERGAFAQFALEELLPTVSEAVCETVSELMAAR